MHEIGEFKRYRQAIRGQQKIERDQRLEEFLVMPDFKNMAHYYIESDNALYLEQALESGCGFLSSIDWGTPLDLAIKLRSANCFEVCMNFIRKESKHNSAIMDSLINPFYKQ